MQLDIESRRRVFRSAAQLCILLVALSVARWLFRGYQTRAKFKKMRKEGVPILPHSWLFGHIRILLECTRAVPKDTHPFHIMTHIANNYKRFFPDQDSVPPVLYFDIWPLDSPFMIVIDPALSAQFTQEANLPKHEILGQILVPLTYGKDLVSLNGDEWKFWRTRFNPGFSGRNLMSLFPEILEEIETFGKVLDRHAGPGNDWGSVFPLEEDAVSMTYDVIGRAMLDVRFGEQSGKQSTLRSAFIKQVKYLTVAPALFRIPEWLALRKQWDIAKNNRTMRDFLMPYIKERMTPSLSKKRQTVVDLALASVPQINDVFLHGIVQNLKIFLAAGYDTTASTVCWAFYLLERNPDCLERLRAEHDSVLGQDPSAAEDTLRETPQLINSLPYTAAVIKETLRLHPPALTFRQGNPGFSLSKPGYPPLPTDGFMIWNGVPRIHRTPDSWVRPNEFIPDRFLVGSDDPLYPPKNGWRPFEQPPRSCIGQELAMMELKLALVVSVRRFEVALSWDEWDRLHLDSKAHIDGERMYGVGTSTVHPKEGMPVRVRRRI